MEVSGVVFRPLPSFSGAGIDAMCSNPSIPGVFPDAGAKFSGEFRQLGIRQSRSSAKPRNLSSGNPLWDMGHVQFYCGPTSTAKKVKQMEKEVEKEKKVVKKKLKLLQGLSKGLSTFSDMGFGLDPENGLAHEVKAKIITEATDLLLAQLQHLKAEEKELKKKRKDEKAKVKAARMQNMVDCEVSSGSSSSSESSDSECGETVNMFRLKSQATLATIPRTPSLTQEVEGNPMQEPVFDVCSSSVSEQNCCSVNVTGFSNVGISSNVNVGKKIEVCMGGKCKKSGAASLLEEFQRVVGCGGDEGPSVVGCKCMGKCREGPNVRVLNGVNVDPAEGIDDSVNPLCIGVGLEDVGLIVANFLGGNQSDHTGLAAAVAL